MRPELYLGACAILGGLAITLVLASWLTPHAWWRRPTARNLFIVCAGTWAFGSLILNFAIAPPPHTAQAGLPGAFSPRPVALAAMPAATSAARSTAPSTVKSTAAAAAPRSYRVHRDLNLRAAASVEAPRLALVPAGASVTPTGLRSGDWWQVRTLADGKPDTGWVSSLWLRRAAE
ncbi:SH3 domain-containing protein [Pseudoduganella sp. LjRoot289]|uniref:SH3 domain-containing protein n=1 Tax=Pseudoduganella sp. LjRoot289 TaxID=3342314 RepID=UPI003ED16189